MGVVVPYPDACHLGATPHSWRAGDTALAGASQVRIAALDGKRALVVGDGLFGPWSIWMEASKLQRVHGRDHAAAATGSTEIDRSADASSSSRAHCEDQRPDPLVRRAN